MSALTRLKDGAVVIAMVVAGVALFSAVYEHWFSDGAKLIEALEDQIQQKEKQIAELETEFHALTQAEQERLQEIAELKEKLDGLKTEITAGGAKIDEIKKKIIDLEEALDVIENHTRRGVERARGAPARSSARPGN